ncbi:dnaJ [Symbiodinium sp. KB8]|nr:dnaJ [Symbiodinium sp. KB8]
MKIPGPAEWITQALAPLRGVKRRISKKTAPALVSRSPEIAALPCPYQTLGITRFADSSEIRRAYLRLALHRHPDKLRSQLGREPDAREVHAATEASWRITQAFEILSDPIRRRQHDDSLGFSPRLEEEAAAPPRSPPGDARVLLHGLQVLDLVVYPAEHCTAVLLHLRNLLRGKTIASEPDEDDQSTRRSVDSCISVQGRSYMVRVSFASLVIRSKMTKSLQLALLWRAALTELKTKASLRTGDCPSLFEKDVLNMLSAVPDLRLVFYGQVCHQRVSYRTPATANWILAMSQRTQLALVAQGRGDNRPKLQKLIERQKVEVAKDKQRFQTLAEEVMRKIDEELIRRQEHLVSAQSVVEAMNLTDERSLQRALQRFQELSPEELRRCDYLLAPPNAWEICC